MSGSGRSVALEGLSVLYEPETIIADIIFLHGIQGHPFDTWACRQSTKASKPSKQHPKQRPERQRNKRTRLWKLLACSTKRSSAGSEDDQDCPEEDEDVEESRVFWPKDLLSKEIWCKSARVLTYGYDSKISKGYVSANKNNLFAHAKDFLYALQREKPARRPIIFVVHSLGGLVLKEALRRSECSEEDAYRDIVRSTAGIIFLGTPHRGSPGLANLGETVRRAASFVARVDTNSTLLRSLGVDSPELELGRESFIVLWRTQNFKVKTFQEAKGIAGINVGALNEKVVPDTSSTLDDPREHAETISANHMDMCRFTAASDPGYKKLSAEIRSMLSSCQQDPTITDDGHALLKSLYFEEMYDRQKNIHRAMNNTCDWLFTSPEYVNWSRRADIENNRGLLWIKGKPGAGKSTLMKNALRRTQTTNAYARSSTAAFFFNARGTQALEKSPLGLYRSLLHQVLQQDKRALTHLASIFKRKKAYQTTITWHQEELQDAFTQVFATSASRPAILFIDAMDECCDDEVRELVQFFSHLSRQAIKTRAKLDICFSSRHYPHISIEHCPEVVVEHHNRQDILLYVSLEASDNMPIQELKQEILVKSQGVFLWVALVITILKKSGHGKSIKWLRQKLNDIPGELESLFKRLFSDIEDEDISRIEHLMQIMLFSEYPLSLEELHAALAFSTHQFTSLQKWRDSIDYLETARQKHEMIIELSRGLLEPMSKNKESSKGKSCTTQTGLDGIDSTQTYQFIHETVREFFLSGKGFNLLRHSHGSVEARGHDTLAKSCVRFIALEDLPIGFLDNANKETLVGSECAFAYYARHFTLLHVDYAESFGASQEKTLQITYESGLQEKLWMLNTEQRWFSQKASLMYAAAETGHVHTVQRLHAMGFDINAGCGAFRRYPFLAALSGQRLWEKKNDGSYEVLIDQPNPVLIQWFLDHGADLLLRSWYEHTALHIAAMANPVITKMILAQRPEINAKNSDGNTPFHLAVHSRGYLDTMELFIQGGADVSLVNHQKETALMYAFRHTWPTVQLVELFLEAGTPVDAQNVEGQSILHLTADKCSKHSQESWRKIYDALLSSGASRTLQDNSYRTPETILLGANIRTNDHGLIGK